MALMPVTLSKDASQSAGYDIRSPGRWRAARDLWADYIPDAALDMDPEEMGHALMAGVEGKVTESWTRTWEPATLGSEGWPSANRAPAP